MTAQDMMLFIVYFNFHITDNPNGKLSKTLLLVTQDIEDGPCSHLMYHWEHLLSEDVSGEPEKI